MARSVDPKAPKVEADSKFGDISARLQDLDSRLAAEKGQQQTAGKTSTALKSAEGLSAGYKFVSEFAAGILVGAAIGFGLDKLLGTTPWLLIVFLLLGFVAGIWNMWRSDKQSRLSLEELKKLPHVADDDEDR